MVHQHILEFQVLQAAPHIVGAHAGTQTRIGEHEILFSELADGLADGVYSWLDKMVVDKLKKASDFTSVVGPAKRLVSEPTTAYCVTPTAAIIELKAVRINCQ